MVMDCALLATFVTAILDGKETIVLTVSHLSVCALPFQVSVLVPATLQLANALMIDACASLVGTLLLALLVWL